jgi:DnaK suppressor protein
MNEHVSASEKQELIQSMRLEARGIEQWLETKKDEILNQPQSKSDPSDLASDYEIFLKEKREVERKQERLARIKDRLKNMDDFGYCDDCGIEIDNKRLRIDPTFTMCIDCSDIKSKRDRHRIKRS